MPKLLTVAQQQTFIALLSSIEKFKSYSINKDQGIADNLHIKIMRLYQEVFMQECPDVNLAANDLVECYKQQLLEHIKNVENVADLGQIMHAGPNSWGKLIIFKEIFSALQEQNQTLKERERIVRMSFNERKEYINNSHSLQKKWAQNHQQQVDALFKKSEFVLENSHTELLAQSLEVSNCLRPRNALNAIEYSYYLEIHNKIKIKLKQSYKDFINSINELAGEGQALRLGVAYSEVKKAIEAECQTFRNCSSSEHLTALEACKDLIVSARQKLKHQVIIAFTKKPASNAKIIDMPEIAAEMTPAYRHKYYLRS